MSAKSSNSTSISSASPSASSSSLLLSRKALAASLSPPRAPPFGSAHRALLVRTGRHRPSAQEWETSITTAVHHPRLHPHLFDSSQSQLLRERGQSRATNETDDDEEAHSRRSHVTLLQRLSERLHEYSTQRKDTENAGAVRRSRIRFEMARSHPHLPMAPERSDQITRCVSLAAACRSS